MSSVYYVLCLSHNPAITAGECRTRPEAEYLIGKRTDEHPHCDLIISRVSGGLIELGCPSSMGKIGAASCSHRDTEWTDAGWLRLLATAHGSDDPTVQAAARRVQQRCWTLERVQRLRLELGIPTETSP